VGDLEGLGGHVGDVCSLGFEEKDWGVLALTNDGMREGRSCIVTLRLDVLYGPAKHLT
jgi:hypothetical protein